MTTQPTSLAWTSRSQRPLSAAETSRAGGGRSLVIVITTVALLVMVAL